MRVLTLLIICFCSSIALSQESTETEKVRIAIGEWPPYHDSKAPNFGLASHAIQQAFADQGIDVEFEFYPWTRSYKLAQSAMVEGTGVWFATAERAEDFYISEPVMMAETVFFHRVDYDFDWKNYDDLKGLRVGVAQYSNDGQAFGEAFAQAQKQQVFSSSTAHDDRMLFTMLQHKRIDLFPIDKHAGLGFLKSDFSDEQQAMFTYHPLPVRQDGGHLLLPKSSDRSVELLRRFNIGLKKLRAKGALTELGLPPQSANP